MNKTTELELDENTRELLEHIRELFRSTLPALALIESLLNIPEADRSLGQDWFQDSGLNNCV